MNRRRATGLCVRSEARADRLGSTVAQVADLREPFEPSAEALDVRAAAREELAAEAHVETGPADDVGHEGVAGDEPAAGQSKGEGTDVEPVAWAALSLGEVAFEDGLEPSLGMAFEGAALAREPQTGGQLAQRGLALHDPAQVVLIEVEQEGVSGAVCRRGRKPRTSGGATHQARRPPAHTRRVRPRQSSRSAPIRHWWPLQP